MTPSVLRSSLSSAKRCTSCSTSAIRSFSTTIPCSVGPESPNFVEVPQPPQQRAPVKRVIRGILPPPRDVFASRGGKDKSTEKYLRETIPEPLPKTYYARDKEAAWKRKMAETRRQNLQEGLDELRRRQVKRIGDMQRRSQKKIEERDREAYAPPRDDQVLTSSTIKAANVWFQNGPLPDPNREERIAAKVARVQAKEAEKEAQRRDALHSLYMHARSFITTPEQLEQELDRQFVPQPFTDIDPMVNYTYDSIWAAKGPPASIYDLMNTGNASHTSKTSAKAHSSPQIVTAERIKRIAEELTGGKMDEKDGKMDDPHVA